MEKWKPVTELKKQLVKFELLYALLRAFAIVMTLLLMSLLLMSCATETVAKKQVRNDCLDYVVTWGDILDCAIKLDEAQ